MTAQLTEDERATVLLTSSPIWHVPFVTAATIAALEATIGAELRRDVTVGGPYEDGNTLLVRVFKPGGLCRVVVRRPGTVVQGPPLAGDEG